MTLGPAGRDTVQPMGFLRHRDDGPEGERFLMREKLLSIGDDFWIENAEGERAYKVNGKALRLRQTFVLENAAGDEVARIQERKLTIRDKIAIERDGHPDATVHKALVGNGVLLDRRVAGVHDRLARSRSPQRSVRGSRRQRRAMHGWRSATSRWSTTRRSASTPAG